MAKKETFAERILLKNGWQHGEGLGKNNQGMLEICITATNVILLFLSLDSYSKISNFVIFFRHSKSYKGVLEI